MRFRRDQFELDYPGQSDPLVPGQIGGSLAASSLHQPNSRAVVGVDRGRPPQPETVPYRSPNSVRAFRAAASPDRPRNNDEGVILEEPNAFVWTQNGGAPSGAPDDLYDEQAHMGFDPIYGRPTELAGVGPKNYGNFSQPVSAFTDQQAHEVHRYTDMSDPRHDRDSRMPEKRFETSDYDAENFAGRRVPVNAITPYEKPYSFFTQGRPAKVISAYTFIRPFDQWASQNLTAVKARPGSPTNVGGQEIDATPRASLPLRTTREDEVPGDAYSGPFFPAPGMEGVGGSRNTFRLQPQPWDEFLVVDPGVQ